MVTVELLHGGPSHHRVMAVHQEKETAIAVPQILVDAVRLAAVDLRAWRSLPTLLPPDRAPPSGFMDMNAMASGVHHAGNL